jgi:hypothetical protein
LPAQAAKDKFDIGPGVSWSYLGIKGPSRGNGYEAEAYVGHPELNCSAFVDIGFALYASGSGATQWLTFVLPAFAAQALAPAKTMTVLHCTGARRGTYGNVHFRVQFAVNGSPVGDLQYVNINTTYLYQTCHTAARHVPVPKPGDVFGFKYDLGASRESVSVQTMALIGDL